MKNFFLTTSLFMLFSSSVAAQIPTTSSKEAERKTIEKSTAEDEEVLTVTTSLVNVPASATDEKGRYITDLKQADFRVYENGVEQKIAYFSGVEEPLSLVLLFDVSGSASSYLPALKQAALKFIKQLRPQDTVLPIAFGGAIYAPLPKSTNDQNILRNVINNLTIIQANGTKLYDALEFVSKNVLKPAGGRKAIILFTDGKDNASRAATSESSIKNALESQSFVYVVYYDKFLALLNKESSKQFEPGNFGKRGVSDSSESAFSKLAIKRESDGREQASKYLRSISEQSGGRLFKVEDGISLALSFDKIAEELRQQYRISYYPDETTRVGKREISVTSNQTGVKVRAKKTFIYLPPPLSPSSNLKNP